MTPIRDEFDRWLEEQAPSLRRHWDSPELWPRIAGSLEVERGRVGPPSRGSGWAIGMAAALALVLAPAGWWLWKSHARDPMLLTDQTLKEVQSAEQAYAQSIEKLSKQAAPRLENPPTELISSYREKLMLLDSAISALKAEADRNPYNHYVQRELLALYKDKQQTLEGILHDTANPPAAP